MGGKQGKKTGKCLKQLSAKSILCLCYNYNRNNRHD